MLCNPTFIKTPDGVYINSCAIFTFSITVRFDDDFFEICAVDSRNITLFSWGVFETIEQAQKELDEHVSRFYQVFNILSGVQE